VSGADWTFQWERRVHDVFPGLHEAQSAWLSAVDDLPAPDRKTRELIRLACVVILRNEAGVERHAMLAREYGATWDEVVGTIMLTTPGFGVLPATQALDAARRGFDAAPEVEGDDDDGGDDG
jgi:alkylhydroperoxidase/carboxymuconolactone decarboxylase family protein YurZ